MMKLNLFSRILAKRALFLKTILIAIFLFCGCSSNVKTPKYTIETAPAAIQEIVQKEYHFDIKATLFGETLWIYLPVEDILVPPEKPKKYTEKFIFGAQDSLDNKVSAEFVAQDIKDALGCLDDILGLNLSEDLLDRIFSRFCIGK